MRLGEHPVARGPDTAIDRLGENPHLLIVGRETYKDAGRVIARSVIDCHDLDRPPVLCQGGAHSALDCVGGIPGGDSDGDERAGHCLSLPVVGRAAVRAWVRERR